MITFVCVFVLAIRLEKYVTTWSVNSGYPWAD